MERFMLRPLPRSTPTSMVDHSSIQRSSTAAPRLKGFSLVEALFAIVLTFVGFSAIFSMQSTQMKVSISARDLSAASNLAERVISQLHKESFMWTAYTRPGPHLNRDDEQWHSYTATPVDHNCQPSIRDNVEQGTIINRQRFCIHYWMKPLSGIYEGLLNTRVRVIWSRNPMDNESIYEVCGDPFAENFENDPSQWMSITVPAVIRRHPL